MRFNLLSTIVLIATFITGCATETSVMLTKTLPSKKIQTVAQVEEHGNSPKMNAYLRNAMAVQGINMKGSLLVGTKTSNDVDAIVSYSDEWLFDLVMYLNSLTINIFDAKSGNLLVTGRWHESPAHGLHDSDEVMKGLLSEMLLKLNSTKQQ